MKNKVWGYLRETTQDAEKVRKDEETNLCRTGLNEYLQAIFPDIDDWVHDKTCNLTEKTGKKSLKRPDYRSEKLKMVVEFDGLPHYTNPYKIIKDKESTEFFSYYGYKVVRIPYFIQLTKEAIKKLFDVDMDKEMFDINYPSLGIKNENSPAFLCDAGVERMAKEFLNFPEQYRVNIEYLKKLNNEYLTGVELLETKMKKVNK